MKAVFLLIHGLGANSGWWGSLGSTLLKDGYPSRAVDLRGAGSFREFKEKILELHAAIKKEYPQKKIFAVGESMGSLIIFSMALKEKKLFDGLVCMSPAFKSKAPLNFIDYIKIFLPLLYNPGKEYKLPLTPDMCTRDAGYIKIMESDYSKDVLSTSKILFDIFIAQTYIKFSGLKLDAPVLFLLAGQDKIADSRTSKRIFDRLNAKDKTVIEYPDMYHSLSIDLGKEKVFQDIVSWADKRI